MGKTYTFLDLYEVNRPYLEAIGEAIQEVVASGRYIGGPRCEAFENKLARITGTEYAVGVSNGLDALRLILRAYIELGRLTPGDEVLVAANTYIASVLAISDAGLKPVLVDADERTMNMSAEAARRAMGPRTRAVMPVHLYGRVCWDEKLKSLAEDNNLVVVEDNAQAIGARSVVAGVHEGKFNTGALGHAAAFSFYPTKNIGAMGDAGAVTTDDAELAATVRALANYGSNVRYHNIYKGYNSRLDPVQAAVLNAKLPYLDAVCAEREAVACAYLDAIVNPYVQLPLHAGDRTSVWHQFVIRCDTRDDLREYLAANGVQTDINYPTPIHKQPCYEAEFAGQNFPVAEQLCRTLLCLPVSSCTSTADAREIAAIINRYNPKE
ncbi:MAG: DegT/DnrJ/EryC1/StrS family aminotransferase [Muribaculaceae bacterium]|nr:DegT/DnrJ/EryC1/StrS family aminotransferase [Muribaculaceae bacterium]